MKKYDAAIIGTGQSGVPLAKALAKDGWKVAIIEKKHTGGSCINYGCTPTKAMVASARAVYQAKNAKQLGVNTGKVSVDFRKVVNRRNKIVKKFRQGGQKALESNENIKLYFGSASFLSRNEIRINSYPDVTDITAEYVFINTGVLPSIPDIPGLNEVKYLTSRTILDLKKIPEKLVIIGGSYIALEYGQMFARFGSAVTILEKASQFLLREDEDIAGELKKILEDEGLEILTGVEIQKIPSNRKKSFKIDASADGKKKKISGTHLLIAAGVQPNTKDLLLFNAGIETDDNGFIKVNEKLETNVDGIYAMGDVNGGPAFTHISYDDYRIIYSNLIKKENRTTNHRLIPYTMFTDPELGRVGITEQEAVRNGLNFRTAVFPISSSARAIESGETRGLMKAIVDADTGQILGCAVLSVNGGEIMSIIETAMTGGLHYGKLRDAIFAHPIYAESLNNLFMRIKE